jgi:hypothetical protein
MRPTALFFRAAVPAQRKEIAAVTALRLSSALPTAADTA